MTNENRVMSYLHEKARIDCYAPMDHESFLQAIGMELILLSQAQREDLTSAIVGDAGDPPRLWFMLEHFFERFPPRSAVRS